MNIDWNDKEEVRKYQKLRYAKKNNLNWNDFKTCPYCNKKHYRKNNPRQFNGMVTCVSNDCRKKYQRDSRIKRYWKNRDKELKVMKGYWEKNKKELLEKQKKWRLENKEYFENYYNNPIRKLKVKIWSKEYYQQNKNRINKRNKEYNLKNKKKRLEYERDYYNKNKDKIFEYHKEYRKKPNTKLLVRASKHRYMAHKKYKIGDIKTEQIKQIFERDKFKCIYCGSNKNLELDHIIPLSNKNGNSIVHNFTLACKSCNSSKGNKNVFIWCRERNIPVPKIVKKLIVKQIKYLNQQKKLISPKPFSTQQNFLFCFSFLAFVVEIKNNIKQNCVGK